MKEGHRYLPSFALPRRGGEQLHATSRVKHFADFADAGRGMGFRQPEGEWKGNVVREDNSIPVN